MRMSVFCLLGLVVIGCSHEPPEPWSQALLPKTTVKLGIQPLRDLSGQSTDEIMAMRRKQLEASSLLKSAIPQDCLKGSRPIFQRVSSGEKWLGLDGVAFAEESNFKNRYFEGVSVDSLEILNPYLLVAVEYDTWAQGIAHDVAAMATVKDEIIPDRAEFNGPERTLKLHYTVHGPSPANRYCGGGAENDSFSLLLNHLNAKDLGFRALSISSKDLLGVALDSKKELGLKAPDQPVICDDRYEFWQLPNFEGVQVNTHYRRSLSYSNFRVHQYPAKMRVNLYRNQSAKGSEPPDFQVLIEWDNSDPQFVGTDLDAR